jgi:hypothetical protein
MHGLFCPVKPKAEINLKYGFFFDLFLVAAQNQGLTL